MTEVIETGHLDACPPCYSEVQTHIPAKTVQEDTHAEERKLFQGQTKPVKRKKVSLKAGTDKGEIFANLVHLAVSKGIIVRFAPLPISKGRLKANRIAIRQDMNIDSINDTLAHEIAHAYLHYDKGDTVSSDRHNEYEEQAGRGAIMLLDALEMGVLS